MADRRRIYTDVGQLGIPDYVKPDEKGQLTPQAVNFLFGLIVTLIRKVNRGISFGDGTQSSWPGNIDGQWIEVRFSAVANTPERIPHGLGRVPIGYMVMRKDRACDVYDVNTGGWGPKDLYLACNTASALVRLLVV